MPSIMTRCYPISPPIGTKMLSLLLAATVWSPALGFPSYRFQIPNGFRITCPPSQQDGDPNAHQHCHTNEPSVVQQGLGPAKVCDAVGHTLCDGPLDHNIFLRNDFGQDFGAAGFRWTKTLCQKDSDGDGLTNGEELGDPCCLWSAHDTPSVYMRDFAASHPGFSGSRPSTLGATGVNRVLFKNSTAQECSSTGPVKQATAPDEQARFNVNEEQRNVTLRFDNFPIPTARTTYQDFALNFPDDSADLFHVVEAEAILENPDILHHYVLMGCTEKWPAHLHGKPIHAGTAMSKCGMILSSSQWGAWAPGKVILRPPSWLGKPIDIISSRATTLLLPPQGKSAGVVAFSVNVHYDNAAHVANRISNDGVRLFYTPTLRPDTVTNFATIRLSVNPGVSVPPGKERWYITRRCTLNVNRAQDQPGEGFHLSSLWHHGHLLAREMYAELIPKGSGSSVLLSDDRIWHFDDQYDRNMLPRNLTLHTGDVIQSTCVFDSTTRNTQTIIGAKTLDEMCWSGFSGWPGKTQVTCNGYVWSGELSRLAKVAGFYAAHPEWTAKSDGGIVLSGGSGLTAGNPVQVSAPQGWTPPPPTTTPPPPPPTTTTQEPVEESTTTAPSAGDEPQVVVRVTNRAVGRTGFSCVGFLTMLVLLLDVGLGRVVAH